MSHGPSPAATFGCLVPVVVGTTTALVVGGLLPILHPGSGAAAAALWSLAFGVYCVATHAVAWRWAPRSPTAARRIAGVAYAGVMLTFWVLWPAAVRWAQQRDDGLGTHAAAARAAATVPLMLVSVVLVGGLASASVPLAAWLRDRRQGTALGHEAPRPLWTPGRLGGRVDMPDEPTIGQTKTTTSRIIMPGDTNPQGNAYGGSIVKYLDEIAAVVARRHARANVVTASIERMDFLAPVYLGDLLIFKCALIYTGRTSMIVGTRIEAEDMATGRVVKTGSCYLTFVALDRDGKPATIDKIVPGDDPEEKRWYEKGKIMRENSKSVMKQLKEHGSAGAS